MTTERDPYVPERTHAKLTPGKSLRIVRELQGLSQSELAARAGIPQPAISAIESGDKDIGIERVKRLARALNVHPAVLAFPDEQGAKVIDLFEALKTSLLAARANAAEGPTAKRRQRRSR